MSCGRCRSRDGSVERACAERRRERAAMCATCLRGARRGGRTVGCGHTGEGVMLYINGRKPCPWGKHPTGRCGPTRWLWMRWHGVPMPLRVWLWLRAPTHPRPSSFAGCGCLVALKRVTDSIVHVIIAAARGRRRGIVHAPGAPSHA